jgi:phosphoribosylglycinamide formyltransferase 1
MENRTVVRIALFASGRGSNFRAIDQVLLALPEAPAEIVLCISNNPNPGAFEYARDRGIETLRLSPRMFEQEDEYAAALLEALRARQIDLLVLSGYMRKLPESVVREYRGRILNIHPALLPDFGGQGMYGEHVHRAVLESGVPQTGVTIHLVDEEYDTGAIVAQEKVDVHADDTPETLAARVLAVEHQLYPRVVIEMAEKLRENTGVRSQESE